VFIPLGAAKVVPRLREAIGDADSGVPDLLRASLHELADEIGQLEQRIAAIEHQLTALARQLPDVARLMTIPGIGIITATALFAFIGSVERFPSARHLASYLGLTPREYSSGSRRRLGGISKRGDTYLRTMLIHGARAVLARARQGSRPDRLRQWAIELDARVGHNKAAVALANKITRVVWSVWRSHTDYTSVPLAA
jgi:transposase